MKKFKVHVVGNDGFGWALDEDRRQLSAVIEARVELTDLASADIIHSVWWESLLRYQRGDLTSRRVVCHLDNPPFIYMRDSSFHSLLPYVDVWVARAQEALNQLRDLGLYGIHVPYTTDHTIFSRKVDHEHLEQLKVKWNIPKDRLLLANFYRDTEGGDLCSPKVQKGADALVEIAKIVEDRGLPAHWLLAGPRRFYIRKQFDAFGIPYTYLGSEVESGDDLSVNILDRSELAHLYQLADVNIGMSRWEGGPQAVMESVACGSPMICNRVGLAMDILDPECLFDTPMEAAYLIQREIETGFLKAYVEPNYQRLQGRHDLEGLASVLNKYIDNGQLYLNELPNSKKPSVGWKWTPSIIRRTIYPKACYKFSDIYETREKQRIRITESTQQWWSNVWMQRALDGTGKVDVLDGDPDHADWVIVDARACKDISVGAGRVLFKIPVGLEPERLSDEDEEQILHYHSEFATATVCGSSLTLGEWKKAGMEIKSSLVWNAYGEVDVAETHTSVCVLGTLPDEMSEPVMDIDGVSKFSLQEATHKLDDFGVLIIAADAENAEEWATLALGAGRPVFYADTTHLSEVVRLGGAGYETPGQLNSLLEQWKQYPDSFSSLIHYPSLEKQGSTLLDFLNRVRLSV